jgi:hypothetical protein
MIDYRLSNIWRYACDYGLAQGMLGSFFARWLVAPVSGIFACRDIAELPDARDQ